MIDKTKAELKRLGFEVDKNITIADLFKITQILEPYKIKEFWVRE